MKYLRITYNLNQDYKAAYLNATEPDKGIYHFFNLVGEDCEGFKYTVNLVHSGFTPDAAKTLDLIATFNIYEKENPNKLLASQTFNTKTLPDGTFIKGNYISPNGSKLIVNDTPIRTLCFKL